MISFQTQGNSLSFDKEFLRVEEQAGLEYVTLKSSEDITFLTDDRSLAAPLHVYAVSALHHTTVLKGTHGSSAHASIEKTEGWVGERCFEI